jgi:hypothetical protein
MRKPEPWYWSARKGWYVQVNEKQVRVGEDDNPKPKGKPEPPEAVMREYYRVMGTAGKLDVSDKQRATSATQATSEHSD